MCMLKNTGMNLRYLFIYYFKLPDLMTTSLPSESTHSAEEITIKLLKLRIGFC